MIIIMKPKTAEESIDSLVDELEGRGMQVQRNSGVDCTVLGLSLIHI